MHGPKSMAFVMFVLFLLKTQRLVFNCNMSLIISSHYYIEKISTNATIIF